MMQFSGESHGLWWLGSQFQQGLGFVSASSLFVERIFHVFFEDSSRRGFITFADFVHGLHRLSSYESIENKVKGAFNSACHVIALLASLIEHPNAASYAVYNLSGAAGGITREDVTRILMACLMENEVSVPAADVDALVERTFKEYDANCDGIISYEEYKRMVEMNPSLLTPLTLNVPELIASAAADAEAAASAAASSSPTVATAAGSS